MHLAPKTPRWLLPETLAVVGFVATTSCFAIALIGTHVLPARAVLAGLLATAVASAALARLALRRIESRAADVHALVGAVIAGTGVWGLVLELAKGEGLAGLALGATIGLLPSVAAGVVLALLGRTVRGVRMFAMDDALERVGIVVGACAGLAGAVAVGFVAPRLVAIPLAAAGVGLALLGMTWRRDVKRCAWLKDVYAGKADGYRVVPLEDADLREQLSPLVPGASADAVLLCNDADGDGPYRVGDRPRPVALVQRDAAPSMWPIRARAQRAGLFFVLTVALASAASLAQVQRARAAARTASVVAAAAQTRITCHEARSVFEYRARQLGPVARALFLTHAQDPAIPVDQGFLYLATSEGDPPTKATRERVLEGIGQIPCAGMPIIELRDAVYRPFSVEARIEIEKGETPELVAQWVKDALFTAFRATETSTHEAVQFGYYDRKIRWRASGAIELAQGVRSHDLLLDGKREDIALAPAELAVIREVVIVDQRTGKRL